MSRSTIQTEERQHYIEQTKKIKIYKVKIAYDDDVLLYKKIVKILRQKEANTECQ